MRGRRHTRSSPYSHRPALEWRHQFYAVACRAARAVAGIAGPLSKVASRRGNASARSEMNTWLEGPSPHEKREMGCLGKGCLILSCFIIFLIIAGGIGLYFGYKTHSAVLRTVLWAKKTHVLSQ